MKQVDEQMLFDSNTLTEIVVTLKSENVWSGCRWLATLINIEEKISISLETGLN